MIAVAGGTGRLGTQVVGRLAARGRPVRVLTRDPRRAEHLRGSAAEVVVCDVRVPAAVREALRGAATVVSAVHGFAGPGRVSPASVDIAGNANLVDAAVAEGADVVLLSILGASADHPLELARAKHAAEEHLRRSGARWTIVRSAAFLELWQELAAKGIVFGRGENPVNFAHVADVAAAVERAVLDPALRGKVIDVTGPEDLTLSELVARARPGRRAHHIPRPVLRTLGLVSRQARAGLAMDTADLRSAGQLSQPSRSHM